MVDENWNAHFVLTTQNAAFETALQSVFFGYDNVEILRTDTTTDGKPLKVNAGAVIIATGGFVDNQEMLAKYVGQGESAASVSGGNLKAGGTGGRMGDGINMCWEVGADMFGREHVAYCLTTVPGFAIHRYDKTMYSEIGRGNT